MKLFTIGPTNMFANTLEVGGSQVPYFRNESFSEVVLECERHLIRFLDAQDGTRVLLLTASGTGSMEAAVMNCLTADDKALVIDGGSFGHRFVQLCELHNIPHEAVILADGEELTSEHLMLFENKGFTALLVNLDETSTGQLYNLSMLSDFCQRNGLFFIVDAISAFASDHLSMADADIDVLIVSSQKALSLSPGLSFLAVSPKAIERIENGTPTSLYFDLRDYLSNGLRGQTPFTPAVGIIYELLDRLRQLERQGGIEAETERVANLAMDFRNRITDLPVSIGTFPLSNAVTRIVFDQPVAKTVQQQLEEDYGLVVNPCGGSHAEDALRIAHVGDLSVEDNAALVEAMTTIISSIGTR